MNLRDLQAINVTRAARWHPGGLNEWSVLEWAAAMAGEAGEACNAAKKLKRVETGAKNINLEEGRSLTELATARQAVGREAADTIIYGVLLAAAAGVDIEAAVIEVFNKKSVEYNFPERLVAGGWSYDISAAPKDKIILLKNADGWCGRAVWEEGEERFLAFDNDAEGFEAEPVAWMLDIEPESR